MSVKIRILLFIMSLNLLGYSQSIQSIIKAGDNAFERGNYFGASIAYRKALKKSNSPNIMFKYANSSRLEHDYGKAVITYRKLLLHNEEQYPLARYYLALCQKNLGKYMLAQRNFRLFLEYPQDRYLKLSDYFVKKAEHEIVSCETAFYNQLDPEGVIINHIDTPLNSVHSDFGVYEISDTIKYFASYRPVNDSLNSDFETYLYELNMQESQKQLKEKKIEIPEFKEYNISNLYFDEESSYLYFSAFKMDTSGVSDIYRSLLVDNNFKEAEKLSKKINVPGSYNTQPSIANTPSGKYLLYVSNRNGGFGKMDIWYSKINPDKSFGEVLNLASNVNKFKKEERHYINPESSVNSIDNEVTPFYNSEDSCLYFSSKWHHSFGGYDIYKMKGDFLDWQEFENLGYPVNTRFNDLYFYIDRKGQYAFITSNREGSFSEKNEHCCNDIYYYEIPDYEDEELIAENKIKVLTNDIKELIPITLYFHNDRPDPATRDTTTEVNYESSYDNYIDMIEEYKSEYSKGLKSEKQKEAIADIEYFFNEEVIKGYNELEKFTKLMINLLDKGEDIVITIKGFASPLHSTDYNINLSKRRVNSLINYFTEYENEYFTDFIESGRIKFVRKSFGEDKADQNISDKLSDLRNSVYSPGAAYERKIRVIAVSVD